MDGDLLFRTIAEEYVNARLAVMTARMDARVARVAAALGNLDPATVRTVLEREGFVHRSSVASALVDDYAGRAKRVVATISDASTMVVPDAYLHLGNVSLPRGIVDQLFARMYGITVQSMAEVLDEDTGEPGTEIQFGARIPDGADHTAKRSEACCTHVTM